MRKHWVALLSMLGLAGVTVPVQSQVLKGSKPSVATEGKTKANTSNTKYSPQYSPQWGGKVAGSSGKLQVNQQTLRTQSQGGKASGALTPPPPGQAGGNNALTKTKNDASLTKAGANNQLTKANANRQLTKANNSALTKGNNSALTKANANRSLTKANNASGANTQLTKAGLTKSK